MTLSSVLQAATRRFEAGKDAATGSLEFSGQEFFFDGHFPNDPIVPAFVQIGIAVHLASRALGRPIVLREVSRAVFKKPVGPRQSLEYVLSWQAAEEGLTRVKCEVRSGEAPVAELALRVT